MRRLPYTVETIYRDVGVAGGMFRRAVFDSEVDLELADEYFAIRSDEVLGDQIFPRGELARLAVGLVGDKLEITTLEPSGARGQVTWRIELPEPEAWVHALREAGAQPLPS